MSAFSVTSKGTTGVAPTTVWFGGVVDRLNCLLPLSPGSGHNYDFLTPANFFNQMSIWNTSFAGGANAPVGNFTTLSTAPDGTNTAQLFVESAANCQHFVSAGFVNATAAPDDLGRLKFSQFLKYSGRRVVLKFAYFTGGGSGIASFFGAQAIFDLANGVVGVPMALFGSSGGANSTWTLFPAEIVNYGSGFYRCTIEAIICNTQGSHALSCLTMLDNGTGSAAESTVYAGSGQGVIGWRSNLMPTGAYAISSQPYFLDDFNDPTLANVDKTYSRAPGFTWYLDNQTPWINPQAATLVSNLVQSGSQLTIKPQDLFGGGAPGASFLQSFAPDTSLPATTPRPQPRIENPVGYVGWGYIPPALAEAKLGWPVNNGQIGGAWWTWSIAFNMGNDRSRASVQIGLINREIDFIEAANQNPDTQILSAELGGSSGWGFIFDTNSSFCTLSGAVTWSPTYSYSGVNFLVFDPADGNFYISAAGNLNKPPHLNTPAIWTLITGPPPFVHIDQTQMNTYSSLMLPYKQGEYGQYSQFINGGLAVTGANLGGGIWAYSPFSVSDGGGARRHAIVDGNVLGLNLSAGPTPGVDGQITFDSVAIYK